MLVLTRRIDEVVMIDDDISITIIDILPGGKVRLGINAPKSVKVNRKEVHDLLQKQAQNAAAASVSEIKQPVHDES